jgi:hypothetical protein
VIQGWYKSPWVPDDLDICGSSDNLFEGEHSVQHSVAPNSHACVTRCTVHENEIQIDDSPRDLPHTAPTLQPQSIFMQLARHLAYMDVVHDTMM